MTERSRRARVALVGVALTVGALILVFVGFGGTVTVAGRPVSGSLLTVAVFTAAFLVAGLLSVEEGDHRRGLGELVAVLGWACLLAASLTGITVFVGVGLALLLGAGVYLVAFALGIPR